MRHLRFGHGRVLEARKAFASIVLRICCVCHLHAHPHMFLASFKKLHTSSKSFCRIFSSLEKICAIEGEHLNHLLLLFCIGV